MVSISVYSQHYNIHKVAMVAYSYNLLKRLGRIATAYEKTKARTDGTYMCLRHPAGTIPTINKGAEKTPKKLQKQIKPKKKQPKKHPT